MGKKKIITWDSGKVVFEDNSDDVLSELDEIEIAVLTAIGEQCKTYAKAECPVGSEKSTGIKGYIGGTLRSSISSAVSSEPLAYVGTNVYYAP